MTEQQINLDTTKIEKWMEVNKNNPYVQILGNIWLRKLWNLIQFLKRFCFFSFFRIGAGSSLVIKLAPPSNQPYKDHTTGLVFLRHNHPRRVLQTYLQGYFEDLFDDTYRKNIAITVRFIIIYLIGSKCINVVFCSLV